MIEIFPFTPRRSDINNLLVRTIGREKILETLHRRFLNAVNSKNRIHSLLIGPHGSGKSHIVALALHRLQCDKVTQHKISTVQIYEDIVGITRFNDLLNESINQLSAGMKNFHNEIANEEELQSLTKDKVLLLVIENLDKVFNNFKLEDQQRFRAWVETSNNIFIFATAAQLFPGVSDRNLPWFGNFTIDHLENFTLEQGTQLLLANLQDTNAKLSRYIKSDTGQKRLMAIHTLTGGSPRVWNILSGSLTTESLDQLLPAIYNLAERLVPYYQHQLWELSSNEQRVIQRLASRNQPSATVSELAAEAGIPEKTVGITVKRLEKRHWLRSEKSSELDGRATWYRIRDPLLSHHLHFRNPTNQHLALTVELLRIWYDPHASRTSANQFDITFGNNVQLNEIISQLPQSKNLLPLHTKSEISDLQPLPLLIAAAQGSAEAAIRLPTELQKILTESREQPSQ